MAARRRRKSTVAEQQLKMAVVEKNLSSSVRSAVPFFHRQAMVGCCQSKPVVTSPLSALETRSHGSGSPVLLSVRGTLFISCFIYRFICDKVLSSVAHNLNMRPYSTAHLYQVRSITALRTYERAHDMHAGAKAGRCRLTLSNPS
jgi:hypothetical protein